MNVWFRILAMSREPEGRDKSINELSKEVKAGNVD